MVIWLDLKYNHITIFPCVMLTLHKLKYISLCNINKYGKSASNPENFFSKAIDK